MIKTVDYINGMTFHSRKGAVKNVFRYSTDYVLLDADAQIRSPRLFSRNGRGFTALNDLDHGGSPKNGCGSAWVRDVLAAHDVSGVARIELLAQPRVLGHVFNPVSFWLCRSEANDELIAVIAEVSNTFGDRHSYLLHHPDLRRIISTDRLQSTKLMHVSPFQSVDGGYEFRFDIRDDRIGVWIDYSQGKDGLIATLTGTREPLTNRSIIYILMRRPFGSWRMLSLIHWQALKLWWKKARFRSCPEAPAKEISRG